MASYLDKTGLTTLWSKMKTYVSSNYLSLGGGSLTGELTIENSDSSGFVRLKEDGEGGTIQIGSKNGTYIYEIDAFDDESLRVHTATRNPNSGYKSISWNGNTGVFTADKFAGNLAGTADYATYDNFGVALHSHMKSGGTLSRTDLNDAYGAARWYWIHEPTANNYEFTYGSMLTFGDNPYNQIVLAYHTDTIAPTLRWRTKVNNVWQPWSVALDNHNYNLFALPLSGGTLSGSLTIPSNNKLTVYQVDLGTAYLYTDANGSFMGRTGTASGYHYFNFEGSTGNLWIDGNKALHAANFTQHAISRWGDTMEGNLSVNGLVNIGNAITMYSNGEGANLVLGSPNDISKQFQFDTHDQNLRLYYSTTSGNAVNGGYWVFKTNGEFHSQKFVANNHAVPYVEGWDGSTLTLKA